MLAIVLGMLIFVLVKIFGNAIFTSNRSFQSKGLPNLDLLDEEELELSELEMLLKQAIASKAYRLAIRLYYLMIIKQLTEKELIKWKKDKTNREYLREMSQNPHYNGFREVTSLFEIIWYGEVDLKEKDFSNIHPKFKSLMQHFNT